MAAKFKSFSDFEDAYNKKGCIDKVASLYHPAKKLNAKQIARYYSQYVKKWGKAYSGVEKENPQSEDSKLSAFVRSRDCGCRLLKLLSEKERAEWGRNHGGLGFILDAAHIFSKGAFPRMRHDEKNVVTLNRYSHYCLDGGKHPLNGKPVTDAERLRHWERIAGKDDWEYLLSRSREKR